ncbi:replication initiator protein A, partial [Acidiphilium multivorum]|uniref:replication initiator protein A n=1 Tax=Acidiphilium multivorum TaxID=62140 RepID=UPI0039C92777
LAAKRVFDSQFNLFVPFIADLSLRDQRETMERPFFSLSKRKRLKPIEYVSPNGEVFVNVYPNQEFGMATIWDADILIWAASTINNMRKAGVNDIPRTLYFHPYDLLKTIGRETGGRQYLLLREGLGRLQSTSIVTNIRAKRGKKHRQFSWIESWTDFTDEEGLQSRGMSLTLSDWFYEGVIMDGGLLSIDPAYFTITGGRERWLYRVARKHAGRAGEGGFAIPLPTLFEKSGAEGLYRRFKFEIQAIVHANDLPGVDLSLEFRTGEPTIRMVRREDREERQEKPVIAKARPSRGLRKALEPSLPLFMPPLSEETIERVRKFFPGWDIYALKAEFDAWLAEDESRAPTDYDAAFYGFVRQFSARKAHV